MSTITDARVKVTCPGRNFVKLKIETIDGVYGVGDATLNGRELAVAAALHFDLSIPNFGIQEYMRHSEATDAVFPQAYRFADGVLHPGDAAGLGVDIDESLASKYPYKPAYLPVNRLEDGSMFDW